MVLKKSVPTAIICTSTVDLSARPSIFTSDVQRLPLSIVSDE